MLWDWAGVVGVVIHVDRSLGLQGQQGQRGPAHIPLCSSSSSLVIPRHSSYVTPRNGAQACATMRKARREPTTHLTVVWLLQCVSRYFHGVSSEASDILAALDAISQAVADLRHIFLTRESIIGQTGRMSTVPTSGLVGKPIDECLTGWADSMAARGVKPMSVERMLSLVERVAEFNGWQTSADVTYSDAVSFLASKRRAGDARWSGPTYDQAASTLRVFGEYLRRSGGLAVNPLRDLEASGESGAEGARALSVEQARAMIAASVERHLESRRAKGAAPLVWLFMFKTGLRVNETASIRWANVLLDEPIPVIVTDPAWDKSGRRNTVPINAELAVLLRQYRDIRTSDDALFPITPNADTWHKDRERAGVPTIDVRGRRASMHAARKSFSTWLDKAGVPAGQRSQLLRHAETLAEARYTDHGLPDLAAAIDSLEPLWPKGLELFSIGFRKTAGRRGGSRYSASTTQMHTHRIQPGSDSGSCRSHLCGNYAALEPLFVPGSTPAAPIAAAASAIESGNGHFLPESDPLILAVRALAAYVANRVGNPKGADRGDGSHLA